MSLLRDKFISFLQLKGFTKATVRNYIQSIKQFQDWFEKSPVHVTRETAHRYLDYLKNDKKLAPRTMNIHIYALKRFCDFFLPESDVMAPFSRMRTPKYQPHIISASETQTLINAAPNLKAKAIITVLYSAGLRISECLNLKITDIDSKRMVIHVFGKGQRERYALLSPITLQILRDYYRQYRPLDYLFPGYNQQAPLSGTAAARVIRTTAKSVGISTHVTAHVLRHSFATHLLERGESLLVIQKLLGHANLATTAMYTQVSAQMLQEVKSPLDQPPATPQLPVAPPSPAVKRGRPQGSKNKPLRSYHRRGSVSKKRGRPTKRKGGRS
jgi:site-specific recombinase XerD